MRKRAETHTQRYGAHAAILAKQLALNAGGQVMAARLDRMNAQQTTELT